MWRHPSMLLGVLGLVAACSSDPVRPPPAGNAPVQPGVGNVPGGGGDPDASAAEAGVDGSLPDAGTCNDVILSGVTIDRLGVLGDPPAGNGGTVIEGTYDLTSASVYVGVSGAPGPTGISYQSTIVVAGTTIQKVLRVQSSAAPPEEDRVTDSFAALGGTLTLTRVCPTGGQEQLSYTATPTSLTLTSNVTRESLTYTKR